MVWYTQETDMGMRPYRDGNETEELELRDLLLSHLNMSHWGSAGGRGGSGRSRKGGRTVGCTSDCRDARKSNTHPKWVLLWGCVWETDHVIM